MTGPKLFLPDTAVAELVRVVPSWHVCADGPVPFGQTSRIRLRINMLLRKSREEAEEALWEYVREMCELWRHEFDEEEWDVNHVLIMNGN